MAGNDGPGSRELSTWPRSTPSGERTGTDGRRARRHATRLINASMSQPVALRQPTRLITSRSSMRSYLARVRSRRTPSLTVRDRRHAGEGYCRRGVLQWRRESIGHGRQVVVHSSLFASRDAAGRRPRRGTLAPRPTACRRNSFTAVVLWNIDLTLVDVTRVTRDAYVDAFRRVTGRPLVQLPQMAGQSESEIFFEALARNDAAPTVPAAAAPTDDGSDELLARFVSGSPPWCSAPGGSSWPRAAASCPGPGRRYWRWLTCPARSSPC